MLSHFGGTDFLTRCTIAAVDALSVGMSLAALRCPKCHALHLDELEWSTREHRTHRCLHPYCRHEWKCHRTVVGNPLASLKPSIGAVDNRPVLIVDPKLLRRLR